MKADKVASGLGVFSILLGIAEVAYPGKLTRSLGMEDRKSTVRGFGFREMGAGFGLLTGRGKKAPWLWGRVSGDALDLAALGSAFTSRNPKKSNVGIALAIVAAITALDVWCARELSRAEA